MSNTVTIEAKPNDQQRTAEWKLTRMGRFSCSNLHRLMTDPQSKADKEAGLLSDGAVTYIEECISEKLTGMPAKDEFVNKDMQWGIDNEPIAKQIYEAVFGHKVEDSGYIPYGENFGGSPDGLLATDGDPETDGGVEIKCPGRPGHVRYRRIRTLAQFKEAVKKSGYYWQVVGYFIVTGRKWFDFVSYNPQFPGVYQLHRFRIKREEVQSDIDAAITRIDKSTQFLNTILKSELNYGI